jgi:uncharacterized protein
MKVLIDINHPAHVHFFRFPALQLEAAGHECIFTSREKDVTQQLLQELGFRHRCLSSMGGGMLSLAKELVSRNYALWRVVREERPQVMLAIGGTFIAHVGFLTRVPALVFYDTENARLQNLITYPLAREVIVPDCYDAWLPRRHRRYRGYHELSYLHPTRFQPDLAQARAAGLDSTGDVFMVRLVSWQANHDVGEIGWSPELLEAVVAKLSALGQVIIVSEMTLPEQFDQHLYRGPVADIHHVMAHLRLFIGESATMASECAVLGVPAIYAAHTGRGYTDEQESRYGLVKNIDRLDQGSVHAAIDAMLALSVEQYQQARENMLSESIDVCDMVVDSALEYGESAG